MREVSVFDTVKHTQHDTQGRGDWVTGLLPPCLMSSICEREIPAPVLMGSCEKTAECHLVKSRTPSEVHSMKNLGFEELNFFFFWYHSF